MRSNDLEKEKDMKEQALAKLTTREREIRKRIEDALDPQSRPHVEHASPLKAADRANGATNTIIHINGDLKKANTKKRKVQN